MKKHLLYLCFITFFLCCSKKEMPVNSTPKKNLTDNALIISSDIPISSLIKVDSTQLTFSNSDDNVKKIKVGSVLVSDISSVAPVGFLRRVTSISTQGTNIICTTEQAALTDAVLNGSVIFTKTFTDNDLLSVDSSGTALFSAKRTTSSLKPNTTFNAPSLTFPFSKQLNSLININGKLSLSPTFEFTLDIKNGRVTKFLAKLILTNTNILNVTAGINGANFHKEATLFTFPLKPFSIIVSGVPIPIAKQWIEINVGVDGDLTAKVTASAQNVSTSEAGIDYENNTWTTINNQTNGLTSTVPIFQGSLHIEPYVQANYEIRPYGIRNSNIYIGVKGYLLGEATANGAGLNESLSWGVSFLGKAQIKLFDKPILDYENTFFDNKRLLWNSTGFAYPSLTTTPVGSVSNGTASCGGSITADGGAAITSRGICWNTSPNPTIANNKTSDGAGVGNFTSLLSGLLPNTTYYVCAYATNSAGTAYGNTISFSTTSDRIGVTVAQVYDVNGARSSILNPVSVWVDASNNIYVADIDLHRVIKWRPGVTAGTVAIDGNLPNFTVASKPEAVYVDNQQNIYIADANNNSIQKWVPNSASGIIVAGGNGSGTAINQLAGISGMALDLNGNVYISEQLLQQVVKWPKGATEGIIVAGGNGVGNGPNQFNNLLKICLDNSNNLYVADVENDRVQKWAPGATVGVTVAGGNGRGSANNQLSSPTGVFIDKTGNLYVTDSGNNRVQKWAPGATVGITVAGGNGSGAGASQLKQPIDVFVDSIGNIYIADEGNGRIQKWPPF